MAEPVTALCYLCEASVLREHQTAVVKFDHYDDYGHKQASVGSIKKYTARINETEVVSCYNVSTLPPRSAS